MLRNLQRNQELFESYDQVIQEQLAEGVVEKVNVEVNCGQREFYLPHKTVIRGNAESTKPRIVYDASARKTAKVYHWKIVWEQVLHFKIFYGAS